MSLYLPLGFPLFYRLSFFILPLALREADFDFCPAIFKIYLQGNKGKAFLAYIPQQLVYFFGVEEQFSWFWILPWL